MKTKKQQINEMLNNGWTINVADNKTWSTDGNEIRKGRKYYTSPDGCFDLTYSEIEIS